MESEWPLVALEELVDPKRPITYGVVKPGAHDPCGIRFVRGGDISDGRVALDQLRTITESVSNQYKRTLLEGGELLVSLVGNPGEVAIAPPSLSGANIARQVGMVCLRDTVEPRYVQYFLASPIGKRALRTRSLGSVQRVINLRDLKRVELPVPDRATQRAIATTLGSIDDRIDNLRQTNTTLEAIAQALFESWFVDFDPVRAKAEGRAPEAMDAATAALFPSEFEQSELGLIPKGWRVGYVGDLLTLQRGFDLPVSRRIDGDFPILAASGPSGHHHEAKVTGPSVTTGRSGVLGRVFYVTGDFWPLNTSLWIKDFKIATAEYAYQFLKTMDLRRLNAGSAVPTLNRNHVHGVPCVLPDKLAIEAYTSVAASLLNRIHAAERHALRLSELRDTLLPRLISGKLRLPGTEVTAVVAEAAG